MPLRRRKSMPGGAGPAARRSAGMLILVCMAVPGAPPSADAGAETTPWAPVRRHHPFLHAYGLPAFDGATLAPPGRAAVAVRMTMANHADAERAGDEALVLDGESYFVHVDWRRTLGRRLEFGLELPVVHHTAGVFDDAIEGWHDLVGLSNTRREGPSNTLDLSYSGPSGERYRRTTTTTGVGDLRLKAALALNPADTASVRVTLRANVDLATGDPDRLTGSGGTDIALGLHVGDAAQWRRLRLTGFAGAVWPGEGDRFARAQRDRVGFAGLGVGWRWSERVEWLAQFAANEPLLRSSLEALGGSAVQVSVGVHVRSRDGASAVSLALVEDVFSDSTTDVAFQVGFTSHVGL